MHNCICKFAECSQTKIVAAVWTTRKPVPVSVFGPKYWQPNSEIKVTRIGIIETNDSILIKVDFYLFYKLLSIFLFRKGGSFSQKKER